MGKRRRKKPEIELSPEEQLELDGIIERLQIQHPEGETFNNFVESLTKRLRGRDTLLAALIDRISKKPTEAAIEVFKVIKDYISPKYKKILKRAVFRLKQQGYTFEEADETSGSKKVVLIQKTAEKRDPSAALLLHNMQYLRPLIVMFPPTPYLEGTLILAVEDFFNSRMETHIVYGSKNELNDLIKNLRSFLKYYQIPMYHAAWIFNKRLEIFSDMLDPETREQSFEARRLLQEFLPDEPEKFFSENLKEPDSTFLNDISEILSEVKSFDFEKDAKFEEFLYFSLEPVLNPTIDCSDEAKLYQIEKKVLEFFRNLGDFSINRYWIYLQEEITRLILEEKQDIASKLYSISKDLKNKKFENILKFLTQHILFLAFREVAILKFTTYENYKNSPYFNLFGDNINVMQAWADKLGEECLKFIKDILDEEKFELENQAEIQSTNHIKDDDSSGFKKLESGIYVPDSWTMKGRSKP